MMGRDPGQGDVICHPSTATKGIPASVDFGRWESRYCSLVAEGYPRIKPGWKGREVWLSQSSPLTPGLAFQRSARLKKHLLNISADSTSDYIKFCLFHHHTLLFSLTPNAQKNCISSSNIVRFPNPIAPGSDIQIHVSWGTRLLKY